MFFDVNVNTLSPKKLHQSFQQAVIHFSDWTMLPGILNLQQLPGDWVRLAWTATTPKKHFMQDTGKLLIKNLYVNKDKCFRLGEGFFRVHIRLVLKK